MKKLLKYTTADGSTFLAEVNDSSPGEAMRGGADDSSRGIIQNAAESFEDALKPLKAISSSLINTVKSIAGSPEEVGIELGLTFSARAGIILTSIDSEANIKITLTWKKSDQSTGAGF